MTGYSYVYSVIHIFWIKIFNLNIGFIWLYATYVILNFYRTTSYITVPLVKNCFITKGPLNGVSYFYSVWLRSMTLSMTLWS